MSPRSGWEYFRAIYGPYPPADRRLNQMNPSCATNSSPTRTPTRNTTSDCPTAPRRGRCGGDSKLQNLGQARTVEGEERLA